MDWRLFVRMMAAAIVGFFGGMIVVAAVGVPLAIFLQRFPAAAEEGRNFSIAILLIPVGGLAGAILCAALTFSRQQRELGISGRPWFAFSLRTMFAGITLVCCSLGAWLAWDYIPGTIRVSDRGYPRGTGTVRYNYPSGSIMLEEYFRNGLIIRATWYRPDGSVLASSELDVKRGGDGYYLRDDGTIKQKCHYKYDHDEFGGYYVPDGPAVIYKPDGSIDREFVYRDGVEVPPGSPMAGATSGAK
jgi:hypothetical protein